MLQRKFNRYIDFARTIMRALPAEEVPTDLTDAHMWVKATDLFNGLFDELSEEDLKDGIGIASGDAIAVSLTKVMAESVALERHVRSLVFNN